jgi:hypothetical protein
LVRNIQGGERKRKDKMASLVKGSGAEGKITYAEKLENVGEISSAGLLGQRGNDSSELPHWAQRKEILPSALTHFFITIHL